MDRYHVILSILAILAGVGGTLLGHPNAAQDFCAKAQQQQQSGQ